MFEVNIDTFVVMGIVNCLFYCSVKISWEENLVEEIYEFKKAWYGLVMQ